MYPEPFFMNATIDLPTETGAMNPSTRPPASNPEGQIVVSSELHSKLAPCQNNDNPTQEKTQMDDQKAAAVTETSSEVEFVKVVKSVAAPYSRVLSQGYGLSVNSASRPAAVANHTHDKLASVITAQSRMAPPPAKRRLSNGKSAGCPPRQYEIRHCLTFLTPLPDPSLMIAVSHLSPIVRSALTGTRLLRLCAVAPMGHMCAANPIATATTGGYLLTESYLSRKVNSERNDPSPLALLCTNCYCKATATMTRIPKTCAYFPTSIESLERDFFELLIHVTECLSGGIVHLSEAKSIVDGSRVPISMFCRRVAACLNLFHQNGPENPEETPLNEEETNSCLNLFHQNGTKYPVETPRIKEETYSELMDVMENAVQTSTMTLKGVVARDLCTVMELDAVLDDPVTLLICENLELVRLTKGHSPHGYKDIFSTQLLESQHDLFVLQCNCCHARKDDSSSLNPEALVLIRDSTESLREITRLIYGHWLPKITGCFKGSKRLKLQLHLPESTEQETLEKFANPLGEKCSLLIDWIRSVAKERCVVPQRDTELWTGLRFEQIRKLIQEHGTIPSYNMSMNAKGTGPGSSVLECEAFPKYGLLHGKIELPTATDSKFTRRINRRLAFTSDSPNGRRLSSKVLDAEILSPDHVGRLATKYSIPLYR